MIHYNYNDQSMDFNKQSLITVNGNYTPNRSGGSSGEM